MLVTILAGNSTLRWIVWDGEAETGRGAVSVSELGPDDALPPAATQGLRGAGRAVLVSVNPPLAARVHAAAAAADATLQVFGDTLPSPLRLSPAMTDPDRIGTDRLVASYGAWRLADRSAVVVLDVGTAITVNAVNGAGEFLGGAIAVGPHLAAQALAGGTAQLPMGPAELPDRVLGRSTDEALAAGAAFGLGGLARSLIEHAANEAGEPVTVFATGGGLDRLAGVGGLFDRVEPDLALIGLRMAAQSAESGSGPESA